MALTLQHSPLPTVEAGTDEAGRGCLSGPVVAGACILPPNFSHPYLNDSKQLSEKKRDALRDVVENEALAWGIGIVSPEEIDEINILNASILAMHRALDAMGTVPEFIAVDGNKFKPWKDVPHHCQVKGDATYLNIAAASILAKTERDRIMATLDLEFPAYAWAKNKGYPTAAHRKAIAQHGPTPHHRMSFQLLPAQLKLF